MSIEDGICKRNGPIRPEVCGKIVVVVVHGLTYLYDVHRIIHRGEQLVLQQKRKGYS